MSESITGLFNFVPEERMDKRTIILAFPDDIAYRLHWMGFTDYSDVPRSALALAMEGAAVAIVNIGDKIDA